MIIGIDPGQTGGIAAIDNGRVMALQDMPTSPRLHGKGQQVDAYQLSSMLLHIAQGGYATVHLEAVNAMPKQGISSTFRFGEAVGVVLGVCGALQLPVKWVTPQRWKKQLGLTGKDKDAARTYAIQHHPEVSDMLTRKKDIGRADAICIASYEF